MSRLVVYTPLLTERIKYAVDLVLNQVGNGEYSIVTDLNDIDPEDHVINYSGEIIEDSFQIHTYGLLTETRIREFDVEFEYGGEEKVMLFKTEGDSLGYDIFSGAFFLATRMEEYWSFNPDTHGRYTSEASMASKLGFLHLPLINIWVNAFRKKLINKWGEDYLKDSSYKVINTVDIDNAWAYLNKGVLRIGGAIARAGSKLNMSELGERAKVLSSGKNDPYDTYQYLKSTQEKYGFESNYFFLLGDRSKFDKNVPHTNKALKELINDINKYATVGIHPSYASYLNKERVGKELGRLKNITGEGVKSSRQHFLKLNVPETYRILEEIGVEHDYTMGYADHYGFRASICTPFTFFDLLQNKELELTVHPFAYMDGTLNEYMKLSIEEAVEVVSDLKTMVKSVGGEFSSVWHNETLNDQGKWKGWKRVFETNFSN